MRMSVLYTYCMPQKSILNSEKYKNLIFYDHFTDLLCRPGQARTGIADILNSLPKDNENFNIVKFLGCT